MLWAGRSVIPPWICNPSMSQRYCCGVSSRASASLRDLQQFPFPAVVGCRTRATLPAPSLHRHSAPPAILYGCFPFLQLCLMFHFCYCHALTHLDANSGETLQNVSPLLSHPSLSAGRFDGYEKNKTRTSDQNCMETDIRIFDGTMLGIVP